MSDSGATDPKPMVDGPLFAYRALRRAGDLQPDPMQELAAEKLQSLHTALSGYAPSKGPQGWAARLGFVRRAAQPCGPLDGS